MRECVPIAFGERLAFLTHSRTSCHSPHLRLPTRIARSRGAVQSPGIFRPEPRGLERRGFKTARSINPSILESRRPARSSSRSALPFPPPNAPTCRALGEKPTDPRGILPPSPPSTRARVSEAESILDVARATREALGRAARGSRARGFEGIRAGSLAEGAGARGSGGGGPARAAGGPRARKKSTPRPGRRGDVGGSRWLELARGRARPPRGR